MALSEETKKKIIENLNKKLKEKERNLVCPVCGHNNFILADGFTNDLLQDHFGGLVIGGPAIPEVVVVCGHCGHILKFSAGVLGLLPEKKEEAAGDKSGSENSEEKHGKE
ncbi:MAG: hypothetical protein A2667_01990 [Candidatus Wildermuthbacteria bacterium RIFCSPHIGHO2_01_FULL_47_27]|uniref:Uncharacterized protein n=1 Tax=Candidatus Wildermuthbacteria bacterium RIFCSPHIGHO2_02_FULL_47_17 TaxID=1802452 RepID=A0A1G2R2U6_9BACT|nr:MAG: hypothetical protein UY15_C0036G0005 [Parcubacteria group bacterium GW2011_GWA2_47_9]OHA64297.1 MAG: hypothetical protein A2667_01990 [Candidatus Wildermuthbacteria bacterium RIFCSPHIGHO2_01_FULL_47_27]OHA67185.1 MAG: hypothetical protein A3D59_02330 [Candidatus Wildermuthbacteria bacterium RIFCSPHIGHO2_02_FULL_47_17]